MRCLCHSPLWDPWSHSSPGSLRSLVPSGVSTSLVSHYATKRRVHRPEILTPGPVPLSAVFVLEREENVSEPRLERLPPARACMALVEQSFALDPTDRVRAASRLRQAAALAAKVPAYALDYPRDFARLPEVHAAIRASLAPRPSGPLD